MFKLVTLQQRNPVTFKNVTFDPSVVAVRDLFTGRTVKTFEGRENAETYLKKVGFSTPDRTELKKALEKRGVDFSSKDSTKRLLAKLENLAG